MSGPNPGESDRRGRSPAERIGQTSNNQPSDNEHPATRNYCSGASDSPILPKVCMIFSLVLIDYFNLFTLMFFLL